MGHASIRNLSCDLEEKVVLDISFGTVAVHLAGNV